MVGSYCGIGITTPQAELDVNGSILCGLGLRAGKINVIERLLAYGLALAAKQNTVMGNTGVSLIFGSGGIKISHYVNNANLSDRSNFQI